MLKQRLSEPRLHRNQGGTLTTWQPFSGWWIYSETESKVHVPGSETSDTARRSQKFNLAWGQPEFPQSWNSTIFPLWSLQNFCSVQFRHFCVHKLSICDVNHGEGKTQEKDKAKFLPCLSKLKIHTHIHTLTPEYTKTYTYWIHAYTNTHTRIHTKTETHTRIHVNREKHTHAHTHTENKQKPRKKHIQEYTWAHREKHACTRVHTHRGMHTNTHIKWVRKISINNGYWG